jgi:hypothetical protein
MGLPAGLYKGFASTSILENEIPGKSGCVDCLVGVSFFVTGAFVTASLGAFREGGA